MEVSFIGNYITQTAPVSVNTLDTLAAFSDGRNTGGELYSVIQSYFLLFSSIFPTLEGHFHSLDGDFLIWRKVNEIAD